MAFKSIFKTKSLVPKITKVSSSIFGRRSTSNPILTPSGTPVSQTLVETNNILQEIQKQLALDFAYRIAQEEDEIKNIRKTTATMKGGKIGGGEKDTKLGGGIGKVFQTVTAPVRGVFSRILGFFGWLAAGFVVNKGLKWLSDNPDRIDKIVNAVTKHWRLIAGLVIGGVIFNTVSNLLGTVVMLRGAFNLLKNIVRFPFRGRTVGPTAGGTGGTGGTLKRGLSKRRLSNLNASHARNIAGTANIGDKARLIRHGFIKVPFLSKFLSKTKGMGGSFGGSGTNIVLSSIDGIFNYFDRIGSGQSKQKAIAGSGARTTGNILGWKTGVLMGGKLGALGGPAAPFTVPAGAIIGGFITSIGLSTLFENIMDKVSDNIGWGNNQLSQVGVSDHEKLFHNRKRGGNVSVVDLGTTDESDSNSYGPSGQAAMVTTFSSEDLTNHSLAYSALGLGIFNKAV